MIVPAPVTLLGNTNVRDPVPSWQMLNVISCPFVALVVVKVELVTLLVRVIVNTWIVEVETVKVGVAEKVTVVSTELVPPAPIEAHPVALPLARTPVGACPVEHRLGVDARAVAVVAFPVVL